MRHKWKPIEGTKSSKVCAMCGAKKFTRPVVRNGTYSFRDYNTYETVVVMGGVEKISYTPPCPGKASEGGTDVPR